MKKRWIIKIICFAAIFVFLLVGAGKILGYDWSIYFLEERYEDFEAEPQVDVIYAGASNMWNSVAPVVVWNEAGLTGYNFGTGYNNIMLTYYQLKYAFSANTPKLVVLDVTGMDYVVDPTATDPRGEPVFQKIYATLPDRSVRRELLREMRSRWDGVDWEMYLFPALRYHERWEDLSEGDFDRTLGPARYKSFRKGSSMYTKAQLKANAKFRVMSDAFAQEINLEYMEKIWELCEENSVQLMLLLSPNLRVYPEIISEVQKFADAHDLNFLYYGTKEEVLELGLKPERDFYDKVHLNIWGQRIYSGIMANYIQEHYSLESHKDDSSIRESWDQSYQDYLEFYDEISEKNKK